MSKEFTKKQKRLIRQLITRNCANYHDDNCIALDEGEGCPCVQLISNHMMCNYFRNAVLPNNEALEKELTGSASKERCIMCNKPFLRTGRNQRYCKECAKIRRNMKNALYKYEERNKS